MHSGCVTGARWLRSSVHRFKPLRKPLFLTERQFLHVFGKSAPSVWLHFFGFSFSLFKEGEVVGKPLPQNPTGQTQRNCQIVGVFLNHRVWKTLRGKDT